MKNKKCMIGLLVLTVWSTGITGFGKLVDSPVVEAKTAEEKDAEAGSGKNGSGDSRITATVPEQVQAPKSYQGVPVIVPDVEKITIKRAEPKVFEDKDIQGWMDILESLSDTPITDVNTYDPAHAFFRIGSFNINEIPYLFTIIPGYKKDADGALQDGFTGNVVGLGLGFEWGKIPESQREILTGLSLKDREKAKECTEELIKLFGIQEFELTEVRDTPFVLSDMMAGGSEGKEKKTVMENEEFSYERIVEGVPVNRVIESFYPMYEKAVENQTVTNNLWGSECLYVKMAEQLLRFEYQYPMEITPYSDEPLFLLLFEEIRQIYENTIGEKYKEADNIELNRVKLGYMRIREDENKKKGLLVPVWDFFGTTEEIRQRGDVAYYYSLLTIDARDGKIIERKNGY